MTDNLDLMNAIATVTSVLGDALRNDKLEDVTGLIYTLQVLESERA